MRLLGPIGSVEMSRDLLRVPAKIRDSERAAEAWPGAEVDDGGSGRRGRRLHRHQQEFKKAPTGCAFRA